MAVLDLYLDVTDRRRIKCEFQKIDDDVFEEILRSWYRIVATAVGDEDEVKSEPAADLLPFCRENIGWRLTMSRKR